MANEIIITVQNQIAEQTATATGQVAATPKARAKDKPAEGLLGAIDAQFLLRGANRLLQSTGNNEVNEAIGKITRYGFMISRALMPPNPIGIATLALTVSAEAIGKITDEIRKNASQMNEVDNARIRAGLLDVSQTRITNNWLSGRQTYKRF
jgi:hypothetical protein